MKFLRKIITAIHLKVQITDREPQFEVVYTQELI